MIQVIEGKLDGAALEKDVYLAANAKLINSEQFTGQTVQAAKQNIADWLIQKGVARTTKNYKMHDWVFARQRYWGEPIPIIHCPHCGMVPVPEKDLPVLLPETQSYEATKDGQSPLAKITDWVNVKCPQCGADAKRETDTMPGWAGSCWYFIRYCDPHNDQCFADPEKMKAWLPITLYNGGNEHTTRHLLYARFWTKFLYDQGLFPMNEFCKARISQGIILGEGGVKMSKSLGNTVDPRDVADQYGTDALRLWVLFIGDYQEVAVWSNDGVKACHRLLQRVWALQDKVVAGETYRPALSYIFNYSIQKITADMEAMKYNTAVSQIMILMNAIEKQGSINRFEYQTLLTLLNPFAPHITEELWPEIKHAAWPKVDEKALIQDKVEIVVQVNAKIVGRLEISTADDENAVVAKCHEKVKLPDKIQKTIYVKNKLINFIVAK
ncbi:MAG: class I tRNA ligase family protein, partial [Clostridia bacterium]|nr:class I tRNA ligase family protein [Clostridia bacterium]